MKLLHCLKIALAAGSLGAALTLPAVADPLPVKPEDGSKHFAAVAKHLELGGLFFTYMDIDGDLAKLGALGDRFIDIARKETASVPAGLNAGKMMDALGLTSVKAIGMSSRGLGKDLYHNRALLYMPDGPKGLMKMFGGKAAPLKIPAFAPADAGMALQVELSLGALLETAEAVIRATGADSALGQYKAGLGFPVPGLNLTVGEFISKLNTHVMVVMRIEEGKKLSLPGAPFQIPGVQVMIAMDDVDFIMEPLLAMFGENDAAEVEKGEGFTVIRPSASLPGELDYFSPALYHDKKSKRIVITSHLAMAKAAGSGSTLGGSEEFKKATVGLPAEANGLTWVTPNFMKQFIDLYSEITAQAIKAGGSPARMEEALKILFDLFPVPPSPVASVYSNVPEGMLFMSNTNANHKHSLLQMAVVPFAFIGGAVAGYSETRARLSSTEADLRNRAIEREEGQEAPAKAVKNNLQQIAFAAQTYFIDNPKAKDVTYAALVKAELIFDLDPVAGESYKDLTLKRGGGELSVKLRGGGAVSHKYQAAGD